MSTVANELGIPFVKYLDDDDDDNNNNNNNNNNNRAKGTIPKSLRQYLSNIPEKHEIKELQKTTVLGTAHTLQKVWMWKYESFHERNNITCSANYK